MIKHLFFDLDGTLLPIDMDFFFQHYLQDLSINFIDILPPQEFINKIISSTTKMINNEDPFRTNEEVFWINFTEQTGYSRVELEPIFIRYYKEDFPKLKKFINQTNNAKLILEKAIEKYSLTLATNPIFPKNAIIHRLSWIECHNIPFKLITTFEKMHFCKPSLAYYQEILDILQVSPSECLMIGNDTEEDLIAAKIGINTCLITDKLIDKGISKIEPTYKCRLVQLPALLRI